MKWLGDLSFQAKLALIVASPLLLSLYFLSQQIVPGLDVIAKMDQVGMESQSAIRLSNLAHEIQIERGYSTMFLASVVGEFGPVLEDQWIVTDDEMKRLGEFVNSPSFSYLKPSIQMTIRDLLKSRDRFQNLRENVVGRKISHTELIAEYTLLIEQIFRSVTEIAYQVEDVRILQRIFSGKIVNIYGVDITRLRHVEKRVRAYAAMVEAAGEAIVMTDTRGVIRFVSPGFSKLTGYESSEVLGKKPSILKSGLQSREFYRNLWQTVLSGENWGGELLNRRKDGSHFNVRLTVVPMLDPDGNVESLVSLHTDITEFRSLEESLKQALKSAETSSRFKSEFLANMSHEIRTPMNAILGMASLLGETELNLQQKKFVRIFQNAGKNLLHVINDILDFSKVNSGQIDLVGEEFFLGGLMGDIEPLMKQLAEDKGLSFGYLGSEFDRFLLRGDPNRLKQILVNLIGNAIKFTHRGGVEVFVECISEQDETIALKFVVKDTGVGIPDELCQSIFESFHRGEAQKVRGISGTGLGLAISKRLVELMGGKIGLESYVGIGSTFFFTVQLEKVSEGSEGDYSRVVALNPQMILWARSTKILLADDSEDNQLLISAYLGKCPVDLDYAKNGIEAVDKYMNHTYDLVLMDIQMPLMDGHEAVQSIRQWEVQQKRPRIPIIALTAYALKEDLERSIEAGCDTHITKPVAKEVLLSTVAKYVGVS